MVSTDGNLPAIGCSEAPNMIQATCFSRVSSQVFFVLVADVQRKKQYVNTGSTIGHISKEEVTVRKGRVFTSNLRYPEAGADLGVVRLVTRLT